MSLQVNFQQSEVLPINKCFGPITWLQVFSDQYNNKRLTHTDNI